MEEAAKNNCTLQSSGSRDMNMVGQGPREAVNGCYHCGKLGHRVTQCPMKSECCHSCGKIGHTCAICRSTGQAPKSARRAEKGTSKFSKQHVKTLQADLEEPEEVWQRCTRSDHSQAKLCNWK